MQITNKKAQALLVIDVQNGMFSDPQNPVFQGEGLISVIKRLIKRMRERSVPIIYVQHIGGSGSPLESNTEGGEIRKEIKPLKSDVVIQKTTPNSFVDTNLKSTLEELNVTKLIVCGLQSELCVDTTCRQAKALGYDVTLVSDGHSTFSTEILSAEKIKAHHNSVLGDWFVTLKSSTDFL